VKIFAPNFAYLFKTKLHLNVLPHAILLYLRQNDANFKNEFSQLIKKRVLLQ